MKYLTLTGIHTDGRSIIIDNDDFEKYKDYKWNGANKGNNRIYAVRSKINKNKKTKKIYLHREIMNAISGEYVDHINGNTLDNRKENLRICSNRQNTQNNSGQPSQRKHTTLKGTKKNFNCKTWSARIVVNSNPIYLGCFKTEKEAAQAYNDAAMKYFGEFARLNKL